MIYIGCHLSVTNGYEAMGKTVLNSLPYDPKRKITPRITEAPGVKK